MYNKKNVIVVPQENAPNAAEQVVNTKCLFFFNLLPAAAENDAIKERSTSNQ